MVASPRERSQEGASCFSFAELHYLSVCGISDDATVREIHILFSACPGYVSSAILADEASKRSYALVQFEDADRALQASASRQGTCWEEGARPISIDLGSPITLAKSAQLRLHFNAGRKMRSPPGYAMSPARRRPSSVCSGSSDGSPSRRVGEDANGLPASLRAARIAQRGPASPPSPSSPSRPKMEACRARLDAALAKKKMAELEEALQEGLELGLSDADLYQAKEVLQKNRHRLGVRQALFTLQKTKQRVADAWKNLQDDQSRAPSMEVALDQAKEAKEQLGSSQLKGDEQALREDTHALARAWVRRAEERLKAATFASELSGLRQSVEEWEALGRVLRPAGPSPSILSEAEVRQAVAQIVAEEAGAKSAKHGHELSLTYVLATVSFERDDWSFNDTKWSILRQQAVGVLQVEEQRAMADRKVEEALARNASLAELRTLDEALRDTVKSDLAGRFRERCEMLEGRLLSRWTLFGAIVASKVSTMRACTQGPTWIKAAIKQARGAGFRKEDLEPALDCFDRMEYQRRLHESLMEAVGQKDPPRLRSIIKEMEVVYVAEAPDHLHSFRLTMARAKLQFLEEQAAAASRLHELLQVRRKSLLLECLPVALSNAKRLGIDPRSIARGEQILQLASAQDLLQAAVESGDRQVVRAALENAQGCDTFSDCSLEDKEKHVRQAQLFEKLSEAVQRNRLQAARQLLQEWHDQAFDRDAVCDIEGLFSRLDASVAKAQAAIDQLLQQSISFSPGTASLAIEGESMIKRLAAALQQFPQVCLKIDAYSGHTNDRLALELATNRAETVKAALRKSGCKNKLVAKSWGNAELKKPAVRITAHGQLCVTDQMAGLQK